MDDKQHYPRFGQSCDLLSRTISKINRLITDANQAADGIALYYAPAECYNDLYRALAKEIKWVLIESGYTAEDLIGEAVERTNPKFIYNLGISSILQILD